MFFPLLVIIAIAWGMLGLTFAHTYDDALVARRKSTRLLLVSVLLAIIVVCSLAQQFTLDTDRQLSGRFLVATVLINASALILGACFGALSRLAAREQEDL